MGEFRELTEYQGGNFGYGVPSSQGLVEVSIGSQDVVDAEGDTTCIDYTGTGDIGVADDLYVEVTVAVPEAQAPGMTLPGAIDTEPPKEESSERIELLDRVAAPDPPISETQVVFQNRQQFRDTYDERHQAMRQAQLPCESPHTGPEDRFIDRANNAIVGIGDRIGVDMRDRIPTRAEHHFFDDHRDAAAGVRAYMGEEAAEEVAACNGLYNSRVGIVVVRQPNGLSSPRTVAHEKAHGVAVEHVDMEPHLKPPPLQQWGPRSMVGYDDLAPATRLKHSLAMTEVSADIAGWEIQLASGIQPVRPAGAYTPSGLVLSGAVTKIADEFKVPPLAVADKLILGSWTTDRTIIDLARTALGDAGTEALIRMPAVQSVGDALRMAEALGLETAVDDLRRLQNRQPIDYFGWYKDIY